VERFAREMGGVNAAFYVEGERGRGVHPIVLDWVKHVKRDVEGQGTALGELVGMVEGLMLTVLGPKSGVRGAPNDLVKILDGITAKTEHKKAGGEFLFRGAGMVKGMRRHGGRGP
jgi:hypothetical protein